ncbi:hypothetical protein [Thalassiella azotivora]
MRNAFVGTRRRLGLAAAGMTGLALVAAGTTAAPATAIPLCDVPEPPPVCDPFPDPEPDPSPSPTPTPVTRAELVGVQLNGQRSIYIQGAYGYAQTYSARIEIRRTSGTGPVTLGPFWLWERDGSLSNGDFLNRMGDSYLGDGTGYVTFAPGETVKYLYGRLNCKGDAARPDESTVFGVNPGGAEVSSGEGYDHWILGINPAEVNVHWGVPGAPRDVSNELSVRCIVPYYG